MRGLGLRGHKPRRFRKTTDSRHTKRIAPNLLERDFNAAAPNQVLAGDITYVATSDGWLYLAVLLDLYSRRVVGWAMSDRIDTELALAALHAAASTRALKPNWIHHTDRDCRYGSDDYLAALKHLGARPSMSRRPTAGTMRCPSPSSRRSRRSFSPCSRFKSRTTTRQQVADYIRQLLQPCQAPLTPRLRVADRVRDQRSELTQAVKPVRQNGATSPPIFGMSYAPALGPQVARVGELRVDNWTAG